MQAASDELVESWYATERMSIQQGNTLSSVTKLQRSLTKSKILKGALVLDQNSRILINFGETEPKKWSQDLSMTLTSEKVGFFHYSYAFSSQNLNFFIFTGAPSLGLLLVVLLIYTLMLTGGLAYFVRKASMKEEALRNEFEMNQIRLQLDFHQKIVDLSKRVAHDIRSPLSALNIIVQGNRGLSEEDKNLLKLASQNINKIAEDLLDKARNPRDLSSDLNKNVAEPRAIQSNFLESHSAQQISDICKNTIALKRVEISDKLPIRISFYDNSNPSLNATVDLHQLQRIISNLLNNSIEAIVNEGFISVTLEEHEQHLKIEIRDSGKGISEEMIKRVYEGQASEGKEKGNGIGLNSAIQNLRHWGGDLLIASTPSGSTITIILKRSNT